MGVYGEIAQRAWKLATSEGIHPPDAWRKAVQERYSDPVECRNAMKHTCPKGAFLGLCEQGVVKNVVSGNYTRSLKSTAYVAVALELLRLDPSLAENKSKFKAQVFRDRKPNDEIEVLLALWTKGLIV